MGFVRYRQWKSGKLDNVATVAIPTATAGPDDDSQQRHICFNFNRGAVAVGHRSRDMDPSMSSCAMLGGCARGDACPDLHVCDHPQCAEAMAPHPRSSCLRQDDGNTATWCGRRVCVCGAVGDGGSGGGGGGGGGSIDGDDTGLSDGDDAIVYVSPLPLKLFLFLRTACLWSP